MLTAEEAWRAIAAHLAPLPTEELPRRQASRRVLASALPARVDVPAWCRMTGQEFAGEETADDGVPRYVVRRVR